MFMDLSKAFDAIHHDLMIAKLGAYGSSQNPLQYKIIYLLNRQKRVRVNSNQHLENIIAGIPQGSILGPQLFNIFINDLFLCVLNSYLSSYTDDNTSYAFGYNLEETKNTLRFDFDLVSPNKCHFMCLGKDTKNEAFTFNNFIFSNSNEDKILEITIDNS